MARVDVYVPEDQLADARYVLLADEIDATLTAPSEWWDAGTERVGAAVAHRWTAAALQLIAGVLLADRAASAPFLGAVRHW